MALLNLALGAAHVLAAGAWLGAMLYSLVVLQPRALRFFARTEDFEDFMATVSNGARWQVLGVAALSALSGLGLVVVTWQSPVSPSWVALGALKSTLFLLALALFGYASWRLWPARVLATRDEIPRFQAAFRRVGWSLVALVGLASVLGVAMRLV